MSKQEWMEAQQQMREPSVVEQLMSWVMEPASPLGGFYRLLVLLLVAITAIALAVWAS